MDIYNENQLERYAEQWLKEKLNLPVYRQIRYADIIIPDLKVVIEVKFQICKDKGREQVLKYKRNFNYDYAFVIDVANKDHILNAIYRLHTEGKEPKGWVVLED